MQFISLRLQLMQVKKYINIYLHGTVEGGQLYSIVSLCYSQVNIFKIFGNGRSSNTQLLQVGAPIWASWVFPSKKAFRLDVLVSTDGKMHFLLSVTEAFAPKFVCRTRRRW